MIENLLMYTCAKHCHKRWSSDKAIAKIKRCSFFFASQCIYKQFCGKNVTLFWRNCIFTALHVMQTRYIDENSVCPSVRPSVRHTRDPWQNRRKICPDLYTIRKNIYPSFLRRRIVGGGDPFYLKFWVNRPPLERNRRFSTNNRS